MLPIYLDYNATTPIDPKVGEKIIHYLKSDFGNPSSTHFYGKKAKEAIETARSQVAKLINAEPEEIIFTSGGTEASNQAILGTLIQQIAGFWNTLFRKQGHMIISAIEHPATTKAAAFATKLGFSISIARVDGKGVVNPDEVKKLIRKDTRLISIMHSNNEVGTLQPIGEISSIANNTGITFHTDAAQSTGKVPIDVKKLGVDFLTIAGHKLYAPKGVGVLYARIGSPLQSWLHGADHEKGKRAGTENVPYIAGLGVASELCQQNIDSEPFRLQSLRNRLWNHLKNELGDKISLNGHPEKRLPNTLNISISGCKGWEILEKTPDVAASTGSACHEGKVNHSQVLCAMGASKDSMEGALRLTVGRFSTEEEMDKAAYLLSQTAKSLL